MKKLFVLILILLLFPTALALEFDLKEQFSQGETLMARVSGNFLIPLQKADVAFYRGHVSIPLEYDIRKIQYDYYIYALLADKPEGNYSLVLKNARYMQGSSVIQGDITKNFTITNQTADFSINPGFAVDNEFSISVQNLQNSQITIEIKTKENQNASAETHKPPITLKSGQIKKIDFSFQPEQSKFQFIELSTENFLYNIPSYVPASTISEEIFKFFPERLIVSASTKEETKRTIYLYNTGSEPMENINVSLSNSLKPYATFSPETINEIPPNSNIPVELTFNSNDEFEVEGHIKAEVDSLIAYSQVSVKFIANYTPSIPETTPSSTKTCAELGYPICSSSEKCSSGKFLSGKDDVCCIGVCEPKRKSNTGKIIGIIILIAIIIFLIWFFTKYKKTKKPFNLLKFAKKN